MAVRLKTLKPDEDGTQRVVVEGLRLMGYVVVVTTRRPKRCPHCKKWGRSGAGDGADKGLADLLVSHPWWPRGLHVAMEVKRPGRIRWSSPEQKAVHEAGGTWVVQSLEDALRALEVAARLAGLYWNSQT